MSMKIATAKLIWALISLGLVQLSWAEQTGGVVSSDALTAQDIAAGMVAQYPIVIYGEFVSVVEKPGVDPFKARKLNTVFRIDESLLGSTSGTVEIEIHSDMLPYQNELTSRYTKRIEIFKDISDKRKGVGVQLEVLNAQLKEGLIDQETYAKSKA